MIKRCKNCKKFIKNNQHFCSDKCNKLFKDKKFTIAELNDIQTSYSPKIPKNFVQIIKVQIEKKERDKFWNESKFSKTHSNTKRFFEIVERVVEWYTKRNKKIYGMDKDDIMQEIRLTCSRIYKNRNYPKNTDKKIVFNFLKTAVHHHLYNCQRGLIYPNNPPCVRCALRDRKKRKCMLIDGHFKCNKLNRYFKNLKIKRNITIPLKCIDPKIIEEGAEFIKGVAFLS